MFKGFGFRSFLYSFMEGIEGFLFLEWGGKAKSFWTLIKYHIGIDRILSYIITIGQGSPIGKTLLCCKL